MLKGIIMFFSISILWYLGISVLFKAKKKGKRELYKLSLFYILLGIAIFFYYLRDVFVGSFFLDILFYKIGGIFHIEAFAFMFLFSIDVFYSGVLKRNLYILGNLVALATSVLLLITKMEREVKEIILDVPYKISYVIFPNVVYYYFLTILAFVVFSLPIITFIVYGFKNKKMRLKSFLYALSLITIVLGSILCYLVSPIIARTLYFIGALISFYAFKLRGE